MKHYSIVVVLATFSLFFFTRCERDLEELELASYPTTSEVFLDGFSAGLQYEAWGDVTAFDVDYETKYLGTASMKFAVPDQGQTGGYAGGRYITTMPRDLSGYTALTFWAKASQPARIDEMGFGHNAEGSRFLTTFYGIDVNTNWKKVIIPIANPSVLTAEPGMLYYAESPENGSGYTFWIDEVQFENLGTLAHPRPKIFGGRDEAQFAVVGVGITVDELSITYNMPDGVDQTFLIAPSFFEFHSSDESVAVVNQQGQITLQAAGETRITASIDGILAEGSLTLTSTGEFEHAPTPVVDSVNVISIFSDAYTNVPVDFYNGYWEPYQTTLSADFEVNGDHILSYLDFNFVGIQFTSPAINASEMTHLHMDVFVPDAVNPADKLMLQLVDMGADGTTTEPNPTFTYTIDGTTLQSQAWVSIDIDLSGMSSKERFFQIIMENLQTSLSAFYLDNIYLYYDDTGGGSVTEPTEAAPTPSHDEADVISLFSDAYSDVTVDTWRTDWSSAVLEELFIAGNAAKKYSQLDFVGIETASNTINASAMTHFHIDVWTADCTQFSIKLVDFGADGAYDGGDDTEHQIDYASPAQGQWISFDIPFSVFVNLTAREHLAQYILVGQPTGATTVYIDNVYFHK